MDDELAIEIDWLGVKRESGGTNDDYFVIGSAGLL
jgi:hypothetical protein